MRKLLLIVLSSLLSTSMGVYEPLVSINTDHGSIYDTLSAEMFVETNETAYVICNTYGKDQPYESSEDVIYLPKYEQVTLIGTNRYDYWQVEFEGNIYYVDKNSFTTDYEEYQEVVAKTYNNKWKGKKLTIRLGTVTGPSGKETFYNLKMDRVVANMRKRGNTDKYWIREDGCKMLGDYIIVAANLSVHPRGSLVQTSLGTGIVCDTGAFAKRNPYQIDIAVDWKIKK